MNNKQQLLQLMAEHHLDRYQVAELVSVRKSTVDTWLAGDQSTGRRQMPDNVLELLKFKLNAGMP